MLKRFNKNKYNRGMTLIELIVVLAIFMIILGLTIFDYTSFKSTISIQNLADDIALSVRKAQSYAIGSRSALTVSGSNYSATGFGIHFVTNSEPSETLLGSNKSFIIFSDLNDSKGYNFNNDSSYNCGVSTPENNKNECIEILGIKSDAIITEIKIGSATMVSGGSLDILFRRPNPDATFCYKTNSNSSSCDGTNFPDVTITVASSKKDDNGNYFNPKNIIIRNTGQISVE